MKLTCEEIIRETVDFYGQDPTARRSMDGDGCLFQHNDGRRCSVGRCMTKDGIKKVLSENANGDGCELEEPLDKYLKKRYRGKPLEFWDNLQNLHDMPDNWDAQGLTDKGRAFLEWIRDRTRTINKHENRH